MGFSKIRQAKLWEGQNLNRPCPKTITGNQVGQMKMETRREEQGSNRKRTSRWKKKTKETSAKSVRLKKKFMWENRRERAGGPRTVKGSSGESLGS